MEIYGGFNVFNRLFEMNAVWGVEEMQSGSVGLMMCGAREDYGPRLSYFAPCLVCVFVLSLDKILERGLFSFYFFFPPDRGPLLAG